MKKEKAQFVQAEYDGKNEYFLTPERHVIEVGVEKYPEDPREAFDLLSHIVSAHRDWSKVDREFNEALMEHVPASVKEQAYVDFLLENCHMSKPAVPNGWADWELRMNGTDRCLLEIDSVSDDVAYTGRIEEDAAEIARGYGYELGQEYSLLDLQKIDAARQERERRSAAALEASVQGKEEKGGRRNDVDRAASPGPEKERWEGGRGSTDHKASPDPGKEAPGTPSPENRDTSRIAEIKPLFSDYVILSNHERSTIDQYTEWGAWLAVSEVKREYGSATFKNIKKATETMAAEMELFGQWEDGEVYTKAEYDRDGSVIEETVSGFYGDNSVFSEMPDGTESLGLYHTIDECFEKNQDRLGIRVDPLPSLEDRIHMAEAIASGNGTNEPPFPGKDAPDPML